MTGPSLSERLVGQIRCKPIDEADLARTALFVLDAVANAVAGASSEAGGKLRCWAAGQGQDAGRSAFLAGALTHIVEMDDLHRTSVTHPGCVVVPAALAVARRDGRDGRALLRAVLHGYEACCRVGNAVGPTHYKVWHNTATCGPFGSAMAVATLLELDEARTVHALGNAGTQSSGLWEFLTTGAMSKHLHAGRAAEAGVLAADLAALGFTGAPAILEGEKGFFAGACPDADPDAVLRDPDAPWQLHETSMKPWPSCRHTHPAIDAALEVGARLGNRSPARIEVATYQAAIDVCDRPRPTSEYGAKFSLQHCVAVALSDGAVGFDSFDEAARARLAPAAARVTLSVAQPFAANYPTSWGARIVAHADGGSVAAERLVCKGDPDDALSADDVVAKARSLMRFGGLEGASADRVIDASLSLTEASSTPAALLEMTPR